ncbi:MAG: PEP/pyruvate-binding domain-containing protein [Planctomycetota bacterium]|jgi:pyruvate,water dikinase
MPPEEADIPRSIPLAELEEAHAPHVGAKAFNLGRMLRAGLPVPPGFCVTGRAYREHIEHPFVASRLDALLPGIEASPPEKRGRLLSELREAVASAFPTEDVRSAVEEAYAALAPETSPASRRDVAVRSTATAEDLPGHSFAGQHDTYLGVRGAEACVKAVRRCWASLWTDRAYEYRSKNGVAHRDVDMAVVVQTLVRADAAGILFTADPVSGADDRIIVEGAFGLGEAVVSSRVAPDRWVLSKASLEIIDRSVAKKGLALRPGESGGLVEETLEGEKADTPCLDDAILPRLGELAKKAEALFGAPQDMEWAVAEGEILLLQSRPITTLPAPAKKPPEAAPAKPTAAEKLRAGTTLTDRQIWTNLNAGEVVPDVVTPYAWSSVELLLGKVFGRIFGFLGADMRGKPLVGLHGGRLYFNLNTFLGLVLAVPFTKIEELTAIMGGAQDRALGFDFSSIPEEDLAEVKLPLWKMALNLPQLLSVLLTHNPRQGERFVAVVSERTDGLEAVDPDGLSPREIVKAIWDFGDDFLGGATCLAFPMLGMFCVGLLDRVCKRWFGEEGASISLGLTSGLPGMQSAESGLDLWRVASIAGETPAVKEAVLEEAGFDAVRERTEGTEGGEAFLEAWDRFMALHGHHARGEIEHANPRWRERPDEVLHMVRGYLQNLEADNPVARLRERVEARVRLTRACRRRLKNPFKKIAFNFLVHWAQRGSVVRENVKNQAVRRFALGRTLLLALGKKLAAWGVLENREDVFFLRFDELEAVSTCRAPFDVAETVAERKADHEKFLTLTPPSVIVGRFDPDDFEPDPVDEDAEVLEGVAVMSGVVRGPARVILRAGTEHVRPGEILVAPFTDPGWTPFFVNAAGIVMDMGGLLSHGSIIAREYGIPAVVNVGPATKIIETGQTIEVDGDRGVVRLLK